MSEVSSTSADGVATLTLDAPDRRNALAAGMVDEIVAAVDAAEADPDVAALVVTGAGSAFCAGAVLGDLATADDARLSGIYEGFLRVARSPLLTIAAVNGAAVGAGMNLALGCDVRIVSPDARFICRFTDIGLAPGGGHTWMLQRLVGPQTAAAMVLANQEVRGADAVRLGLAWACVDGDDLVDASEALGRRAAEAPAHLVRAVKGVMRDTASIDHHDDAVTRELETQLWSITSGLAAEGLARFADRRRRRS